MGSDDDRDDKSGATESATRHEVCEGCIGSRSGRALPSDLASMQPLHRTCADAWWIRLIFYVLRCGG